MTRPNRAAHTPEDLVRDLANLDDELCTWPAEPRLYTRANGADQWPNPVTPLTQTAVAVPQIRSLPTTYTDVLGLIERAPVVDCAGVFYGFVAVGLEPTLRMADAVPGWSAQAVGEQYFGLPPDPDWAEPAGGGSPRQIASVGARVLRAMRRYPRDSRVYEAENRRRWEQALDLDWAAVDDSELVAELAFYAVNAERWRVPLLVSNMIAASVYEQLVKLATRTSGDEGPALAARAMTNIGGIHTSDAMTALGRVGDGLMTLDAWRTEYGFRGPIEYELASRPWGEDDRYLEMLVEQTRSRGDERNRAVERDVAAARARLRADAGPRRPVLAGLLRSLEHHLRWRENTKVPEVLGVARLRLAAREAARRLVDRGAIDRPEDGWFLTFDEVVADVVRANPPDRRDDVARRRGVHERARVLELPELFLAAPGSVDVVPDERIRQLGLLPSAPVGGSGVTDSPVLHGLGASPGMATAKVRVVTDPFAADLQPGEVLVARTTDPAWTPLFLDAAAAVIDLGGALSHGAVIARELGIPCVINVKDCSTRLATGQTVTVDGTRGDVELMADGASTPGADPP